MIVIENMTNKPLWLRLSTGDAICVSARGHSAALDEVLVRPNVEVDRLEAEGVIRRWTEGTEGAPPTEAAHAGGSTQPAPTEAAARRTRTNTGARP